RWRSGGRQGLPWCAKRHEILNVVGRVCDNLGSQGHPQISTLRSLFAIRGTEPYPPGSRMSRRTCHVNEAVEKLRKQVSTLATFGGRALRSSDVGELLQKATELVSEAIEVDLVKVLEILPDGQNLLVRAGVNWKPGVVGHATIPADEGSTAGHALRTDTPVISDVSTESRFKIPA